MRGQSPSGLHRAESQEGFVMCPQSMAAENCTLICTLYDSLKDYCKLVKYVQCYNTRMVHL